MCVHDIGLTPPGTHLRNLAQRHITAVSGAHDNLRERLLAHRDRGRHHKARHQLTYKLSHVDHTPVLAYHRRHTVGDGCGAVDACAVGVVYLDDKLVAVGIRNHLLRNTSEEPCPCRHSSQTQTDCYPGMCKTLAEGLFVHSLYGREQSRLLLDVSLLSGATEQFMIEHRHHEHGHHKRCDKREYQRVGEHAEEIAEQLGHEHQRRHEHQANAECGYRHGREIGVRAHNRCIPARMAVVQHLLVAVDDDDGIVHHHAQCHDESGERDVVERHSGNGHQHKGDDDGQRY